MLSSYDYAYLIGDLLILPIWVFLFFYRKDLRKEQLTLSLIGAVLSVVFAPAFLKSYWHPIYIFQLKPLGGLEDFLNGFVIAGIASVIYEVIMKKRMLKRRQKRNFTKYSYLALIVYAAFVYIPILAGVRPMTAALISFALLVCLITILRHDLLTDALISGLLVGLLMLAGYFIFLKMFPDLINRFWDTDNLSGVNILGIPIEELLFAFGIGASAGPLYEFFTGLRFKKS